MAICHRYSSAALATAVLLSCAAVNAPALGQAVQLPTFHRFGVSTSVVVPDRGSATVAGIDQAREARASRGLGTLGPLGSRHTSSSARATHAGVSAQIHDFSQSERWAGDTSARVTSDAVAQRAASIRRGMDRMGAGDPGTMSVAELQRRRAQQQAQERLAAQRHVRQLVAQGDRSAAAGKTSAARVAYQIARRSADESQRAAIDKRLARLTR